MPRLSPLDTALCALDEQYAAFTSNPLFGACLKEAATRARVSMDTMPTDNPFEIGAAKGYAAGLKAFADIVVGAHNTRAFEVAQEHSHADSGGDSPDTDGTGDGDAARQRVRGGHGGEATGVSWQRLAQRLKSSGVAVPEH